MVSPLEVDLVGVIEEKIKDVIRVCPSVKDISDDMQLIHCQRTDGVRHLDDEFLCDAAVHNRPYDRFVVVVLVGLIVCVQ